MTPKTTSFFILIILVLSSLHQVSSLNLNQTTSSTLDVNFGKQTTKSYQKDVSYQPQLPDISNYVQNNVTDFSVPNSHIYQGNQIVPGISIQLYQVNISVVAIYVYHDHDAIGPGDIFITGLTNGNYSRYPTVGNEYQINDNQNQTGINIQLLNTVASSVNFNLEVRDSDPGSPDDSLGFISYTASNPINTTLQLLTDTGDAIVYFNITSQFVDNKISANDLLNGLKPYMFVDDETSATEMPDYTLGRIVEGQDINNGQIVNALMLQYFLYWKTQNSPDGGIYSFELHKNDFQALYVYYDLNDLSAPYRLVFNNYIYTDLPGFPSENLLILQNGATPSTHTYTVNVSQELQLILGMSITQTVKVRPISDMANWEYDTLLSQYADARRSSFMGFGTFELCVDTSYHTFDLGPGGNEYGYNYNIQPLNDTKISQWYGTIKDTFTNGLHLWTYFGINVPIVAPFTYDVKQVFTAPYIISGYQNVMKDAAQLTKAENSFVKASIKLDLTIGYNFPGQIKAQVPADLSQSTSTTIKFTFIDSGKMQVKLGYRFEFIGNFSYWFVQKAFDYITNQTTTIDISKSLVNTLLNGLELYAPDGSGNGINNRQIGTKYLSLEALTITPKFFGTIIEGKINLDIWSILGDLLPTVFPETKPILEALNFFIDNMGISLDTKLEGYLTAPISISGGFTLNQTNVEFHDNQLTDTVLITKPSSFTGKSVDFTLGDIAYTLGFTGDWAFYLNFRSPLSKLLSGFTWSIGTFPNYVNELVKSAGTTISIPYGISSTKATPFLSIYYLLVLIPLVKIVDKKRKH